MFDDSALLHAELPYDPVKAREYYLRTRNLKGRQGGVKQIPATSIKGVIPVGVKKSVTPLRITAKQRQDAVNGRVADLRKRLDRLKIVLNDLVKEAMSNKSKDPSSVKKDGGQKESSQKSNLTTTQKREAATRSKEFYEKNKKPSDNPRDVEDNIRKVRESIKKIRAELNAAIEQARGPLSNSKSVIEKTREPLSKPKTVKSR